MNKCSKIHKNAHTQTLTGESAPAGDIAGVVIGEDGTSSRQAGQLHSVAQGHMFSEFNQSDVIPEFTSTYMSPRVTSSYPSFKSFTPLFTLLVPDLVTSTRLRGYEVHLLTLKLQRWGSSARER